LLRKRMGNTNMVRAMGTSAKVANKGSNAFGPPLKAGHPPVAPVVHGGSHRGGGQQEEEEGPGLDADSYAGAECLRGDTYTCGSSQDGRRRMCASKLLPLWWLMKCRTRRNRGKKKTFAIFVVLVIFIVIPWHIDSYWKLLSL
jgi:hypothetical protein